MVIWRGVNVLLRMAGLLACWREAERAYDIAAALHRIKSEVDNLLVNEVAEVTRQIWLASKLLRDLFDLFPFYSERGHYLLDYLSVILPCWLGYVIRNVIVHHLTITYTIGCSGWFR